LSEIEWLKDDIYAKKPLTFLKINISKLLRFLTNILKDRGACEKMPDTVFTETRRAIVQAVLLFSSGFTSFSRGFFIFTQPRKTSGETVGNALIRTHTVTQFGDIPKCH
jgi:hypothetical protein